MDVTIVGEDRATKEVITRLINHIGGIQIFRELPARGGKIKSLLNNFNLLSTIQPVILLTDLDQYSCPPELLTNWFQRLPRNENFHVRVAVDEAEAWLMADREGFSQHFNIPLEYIPKSVARSRIRPDQNEMNFPYKSSLYLIREIVPHSRTKSIRESLQPSGGSNKGPLYNSTITKFIKNIWNIENACENSYSLRKTIFRLETLRT